MNFVIQLSTIGAWCRLGSATIPLQMLSFERFRHYRTRASLRQDGIGLLAGLIVLGVPLAVLADPRSNIVAVLGAPHADTADLAKMVAAAGGTVLSVGGRRNVMIARGETDDFVTRLYGAGARLVLDGGAVPLCGRARQDAPTASRSTSSSGTAAR